MFGVIRTLFGCRSRGLVGLSINWVILWVILGELVILVSMLFGLVRGVELMWCGVYCDSGGMVVLVMMNGGSSSNRWSWSVYGALLLFWL